MSDAINPSHYVLANGHQVIEVSENLTSNGGQAVQYIARATRTDGVVKGNPIEDLQKAQWFISRELTRLAGYHATEDPEVIYAESVRIWTDFSKIPAGTVVEDRDGDRWDADEATFGSTDTYIADRNRMWAPFTEVIL
ncbi:hypothetical protein SEA_CHARGERPOWER_55 [Mycobacterium phage Chargerpower]|nr:hypothetical protein SEA_CHARGERPOWER_55 [Mycobacterium phage Chargerpower]